jgi:ABC-type Fe3+ transport system substrate-binding protein
MTGLKKITLPALVIFILALFSPLTARAAQAPAALAQLVEQAKAEGELNFSGGGGTLGGAQGYQALGDAINKKYGLKLRFAFTPGPSMPQMAARLMQEAKAGRSASIDFFFGRPSHILPMMQQGALEPFAWPRFFPYVSDRMIYHEGKIVRVGSKFNTGAVYNSKLIAKNEAPKRNEDVLQPRWKNKIAITPYAAGFAWVSLELGVVEKTLEFHRKLVEHAGGIARNVEERIASGEFLMTVQEGNQAAERAKAGGMPLEWAMLEDFVGVNFSYMGVPKNSPHPNAAKLFIGFLMSPEGQRLLWEHAREDLYLIESSQMTGLVKSAQARGAKIVFDELKNYEDPNHLKKIQELDEKFVKQVQSR